MRANDNAGDPFFEVSKRRTKEEIHTKKKTDQSINLGVKYEREYKLKKV